jgi:Uma2 family endonuclease
MSLTRTPIEQNNPPLSPRETLPTMYDLPSEDGEEPGLPDEYHLWQSQLCSATFCPPIFPAERVFVASDLNLYYDPQHTGWYKRPDWFAVVGVSRLYEERELRLSYVMWQEGVRPIVAIEFLSPSTRDEDLGKSQRKGEQPSKWEVYEQILGIPYYIVFDRYTNELQAFQLQGNRYHPMNLTEPKVWIPPLEIGLGLWQGNYRGERLWLRWYDVQGNWIPTEAERERQEKEQVQQELERERQSKELTMQELEKQRQSKELAMQELEKERQRAEQLALLLRQVGIEPEQF